jgi:DNA-binding transcriptional ArsR family regulator
MSEWTFLTNHGLVLAVIFQHPRSTARELGDAVGITERAIHKIVSDLEEAGYVTRAREGRRNHYTIHPSVPMRDEVTDAEVGELLNLLAGRRRRRRRQLAAAEAAEAQA